MPTVGRHRRGRQSDRLKVLQVRPAEELLVELGVSDPDQAASPAGRPTTCSAAGGNGPRSRSGRSACATTSTRGRPPHFPQQPLLQAHATQWPCSCGQSRDQFSCRLIASSCSNAIDRQRENVTQSHRGSLFWKSFNKTWRGGHYRPNACGRRLERRCGCQRIWHAVELSNQL
jgi:hypothetical protein